MLFSLPSFYWALGGATGISTIAADPDAALGAAAEPWVVGITGVLKLALGVFALSFDAAWLPAYWRKPHIVIGWLVAGLLILYGVTGGLDHLAMVSGFRSTPETLGEYAARWHLFFWDPVWLLGGGLLGLAVRSYAARAQSLKEMA